MVEYVVHAVVSWQKFVSLSFDEAKRKGAQFENIDEGGDFMEDIAAVWQADKERYKQLTEKQARNAIRSMVEA